MTGTAGTDCRLHGFPINQAPAADALDTLLLRILVSPFLTLFLLLDSEDEPWPASDASMLFVRSPIS
jgi:hypothetical protein